MATKKLTPVKPSATSATSAEKEAPTTEQLILLELQKQTEYFNRMDWKLWMLMNMVKIIGEENGYTYEINEHNPDDPIKEE